jgi:hypothetical protein
MGGLVARWYIEKEGGAAATRKLITLGTPYRGALNALEQLVNGVRKGIGPLRFDLTEFARSLPSLYQLLPEYACIESSKGLLKTTQVELPHLDKTMVTDAMNFHDDLDKAAQSNGGRTYNTHPLLGFRQQTYATAMIDGEAVYSVATIEGIDEGGDGTVPTFAAIPKGLLPDSPSIHHIADQHGALQSNPSVLDELEGALTGRRVVRRAASSYQIGVRSDPVVLAGEKIYVNATVAGGERIGLLAHVIDEREIELEADQLLSEWMEMEGEDAITIFRERKDKLLSDAAQEVLKGRLEMQPGDGELIRCKHLLLLAGAGKQELVERLLKGSEPTEAILLDLAHNGDIDALCSVATMAYCANSPGELKALGCFYLAAALAIQSDPDKATDMLKQGRGFDEGQERKWLGLLFEFPAQYHSKLIPLTKVLTEPSKAAGV